MCVIKCIFAFKYIGCLRQTIYNKIIFFKVIRHIKQQQQLQQQQQINCSCDNESNGSPGVATLCNLGNTCFLNSVLYTLRFAPSFLHNLHHLITELQEITGRSTNGLKVLYLTKYVYYYILEVFFYICNFILFLHRENALLWEEVRVQLAAKCGTFNHH